MGAGSSLPAVDNSAESSHQVNRKNFCPFFLGFKREDKGKKGVRLNRIYAGILKIARISWNRVFRYTRVPLCETTIRVRRHWLFSKYLCSQNRKVRLENFPRFFSPRPKLGLITRLAKQWVKNEQHTRTQPV